MKTTEQTTDRRVVAKRAYTKPTLVEYGDVREFTQGPGGSQQDSKGGSHS